MLNSVSPHQRTGLSEKSGEEHFGWPFALTAMLVLVPDGQ
jgi:hypothetical protein